MSYVVSIGTYQPCWESSTQHGVVDDDEKDASTATMRAAKRTFSTADMPPIDVNVAEVHDFFTVNEIIGYEDLGFAERFGAYKLLQGEETTIGGVLPVNTSGELKAKAHPPPSVMSTTLASDVDTVSAAPLRFPRSRFWKVWSPDGR